MNITPRCQNDLFCSLPKTLSLHPMMIVAVPPCRYGWNCWRPGCAFAHNRSRERQEHVRVLAEFWAAAAATAVGELAGEARPRGIAQYSVSTASADNPGKERATRKNNSTRDSSIGTERLRPAHSHFRMLCTCRATQKDSTNRTHITSLEQ